MWFLFFWSKREGTKCRQSTEMPRQSFEDVLGKEFAEHVARAHFVVRALFVPTHTNVKITKEAKGTCRITYA